MKKVLFVIFILLLFITGVYSEIIVLKNGNVLNGSIVSQNDTKMKIKTSYGEVIVIKEEIKKVYFDEDDYRKYELADKDLDDEEEEIKARLDKKRDDDEEEDDRDKDDEDRSLIPRSKLYSYHKSIMNLGFGLLIPGLILSLAPAVFATPPIVVYFFRTPDPFSNDMFCVGFGWYVAAISAGLLLDIGAIICFIASGNIYKKWVRKYTVSFEIGCQNSGPSMGIRLLL